MPSSVESFYQEAGRAGRDGNPALCAVLYHPDDVKTNKDFHANSFKGTKREKAILRELLTEIHYEEEFFANYAAAQLQKEFERTFSLNLFPTGEDEEPFLLYVNGSYREREAERVCYGCLKIETLSRFKPGEYQSNVPENVDATKVLDATRKIIREHSENDDYLGWLTKMRSPGISKQLEENEREEHRLKIGFTNDVVTEITDLLKGHGNDQIEEVVIRSAYQFCNGPEEFFDNLEFAYVTFPQFNGHLEKAYIP